MKKISTFLLSMTAIASFSFAQTQRVCLVEEFTQASCGPCAAANPAFNTLLSANSTKVVSIKYQTDWPGYDPMNEHNPSQVQTRVDYYGTNGVPEAHLDGDSIVGASYTGAPGNLTQAKIDARYAVPSPCGITVTPTYSSDMSKINVSATVTASAAMPAGLVLHIVVVERTINFATAPGSNGETVFYNVMKQMLPTDQGTVLNAIAMGGTQTVTTSWDMKNIYDLSQVAVVAFIQDNATKDVKQAVISANLSVPTGTAFATVNTLSAGAGAPSCNASIGPVVTVKNVSATPVTSFTIDYSVGTATGSYNWTGSLAAGATSAAITLPALTGATGLNNVAASCTNINNTGISGGALVSPTTIATVLPSSSTISTLVEDFQATGVPAGYFPYDVQADGRTWFKGSTQSGVKAMVCDFYSGGNSAGNVDYLYIPSLNLTGATSASLVFDVASAPYSLPAEPDKLEVVVSTDCGATWTSLYSKQGAALNTVTTAVTSAFIPTATQWRNETVDLTSVLGNANVLIAYKGTSGYGNYCWVDNININSVVGIAESQLASDVKVYPNPSTGVFNVELLNNQDVTVSVINALGQDVTGALKMNSPVQQIDLSNQANGTYMIMIKNGSATVSKVITINK